MHRAPIVTITFEEDFRLTILQILSVDRLFAVHELTEYVIVLNCLEGKTEELRSRFIGCIKGAISSDLMGKIRFYSWTDFFEDSERIGFYDQQLLKLAVSRVVKDSPYFLLLDAKNHFTRSSSFDDFFVQDKPIGELVVTVPYWLNNLVGSLQLVGIQDVDGNLNVMFPSITPIIMYTDIVKDLIHHLVSRHQRSLPQIFKGREGYATEFLLYYSYLLFTGKISLYANSSTPVNTLFTIQPESEEEIARYIEECAQGIKPMFGLHRRRISKLTVGQIDLVIQLWGKNLLYPWEDPRWFLDK